MQDHTIVLVYNQRKKILLPTTNKRMNNKIKRKPLQQLINNTKKTIKVITSKNIPISNNTISNK